MKEKTLENTFSISILLSGILLIVWWLLLGIAQMGGGTEGSLVSMVQTPSWLPINSIGLAAALLLVLGLIGILFKGQSQLGALGNTGLIIALVGAVLFTAVQFEEAFTWPLLAKHAPKLLEIDGPMFTNPAFFSMYVIMGILFILGFILLSIQAIRQKIYPPTPSILLLAGAVLFGGGILVPVLVRTIGVIVLGAALIWIGIRQIRN